MPVDRSKLAKTNRNKGHNLERQVVKELREIGLPCDTSRYASRRLDDLKVDIAFEDPTFPFHIQCKCHNTHKNPLPVLADMPQDDKYNIIIEKVKQKGEYVYMTKQDFYEILQVLVKEKIFS